MTYEEFMEAVQELKTLQPTLDNAARGLALTETLAEPLLAMLEQAQEKKNATAQRFARWIGNCGNFFSLGFNRYGDSKHIQAALRCYDASLAVWTQERAPLEWARSQMNRANALQHLGERQGGAAGLAGLEAAVAGYDASLTVWTQERAPLEWATSQMNRANALLSLGRRQSGAAGLAGLEAAVAGYDASLTVWTQESAPLEWAGSQMNRANALQHLGERQGGAAGLAGLEAAVAGYDASLTVWTQERAPLEWAGSQMNRANALQRLGERQGGAAELAGLEAAVAGYDASLTVRTQERAPLEWARSQMNRASALLSLGRRQGGAAGLAALEAAVAGYDASLTVRTQERAPLDWAMSQMNRATALLSLGERQGGAAGRLSRRAALASRRQVLRLHRSWQDSSEVMTTARAILPLAAELADWGAVEEAGSVLLASAPEALLLAQSDDDRGEVYQSLRFAADVTAIAMARQGKVAEAVVALDQGRARALRDHFTEAQAALDGAQRADLAAARDALADVRARFNAASTPKTPPEARADAYEALKQAHDAFLVRMRAFGLDANPLDGDVWRRVAPEGGAAAVFALTPEGAAVFVVPHGVDALTPEHALFLPEVTVKTIVDLIVNDHDEGWLDGYAAFRHDIAANDGRGSAAGLATWSERVAATLAALEDLLMGPLSERFAALGLAEGAPVALVAPGLLANLPLHAAGRRVDGRWSCFLDRWTPSYAPSLAALAHLNAQPSSRGERLLAVTDPTEDFPGVVNPALAHYPNPVELKHAQARPEAVLAALPHVDCLSALCHGTWNPLDPDASGLVMAGEEVLTLGAIRRAKLSGGALIALLACETAPVGFGGDDIDALENLPLGLIQAGAQGVAATFWPVFGHVADELMADFFARHRRDGAEPAAAMRASVLALRDGGAWAGSLAKAAAFYTPEAARITKLGKGGAEAGEADPRVPLLRDFSDPMHWAVYGFFGR